MLEKGKISAIQYTLMIIHFILGIGGLIPLIPAAKESAWLVYLVTCVWAILLLYIYSSLLKLFPGKTIIEILSEVFGSIVGKAIALLYISYFLLVSSLILRSIGDFLTIILPQTPIVVSAIAYISLSVFLVRVGVEVIGRMSEFLIPLVAFIQAMTVIFAFPDMDLENLLPILAQGIKPFLLGVIGASGFPYGEVVVFLMVLPFLNIGAEANKASLVGILVVGFLYAIFLIRIIAVLGPLAGRVLFPSFRAVAYIEIGGFERGESFFLLSFLITAFMKVTMCFYATSLGVAQIFNLKDYKFLVPPLALLIVSLSMLVFENSLERIPFAQLIYPIYIFPLSFVIPLLTLLMAKLRKQTNN